MDARCRKTCDTSADGQVVWSWRPWAGAKPVDDDLQVTVTKKVMDTGESTKQPLTPSRRECRCFGFICGDYACVLFHIAHKAAGAAKHPAFPAPSTFSREMLARPGRDHAAGLRRRVFLRRHAPLQAGHPVFQRFISSITA